MGKFNPLGVPFDRVRFCCEGSWSYVRITYTGASADLLASGAIEPGMESPAPPKMRPRRDVHGDRFARNLQPFGRLRIMRFITSVERALALPGVCREDIRDDVLWLQANPGRIYVDEDDWRIYCLGSRALLEQAGFASCFSSSGWQRAHPVMGGFFAVTVERHNSDPKTDPIILSAAEQLVKRPLRPCLRLAVDNTRAQEERAS